MRRLRFFIAQKSDSHRRSRALALGGAALLASGAAIYFLPHGLAPRTTLPSVPAQATAPENTAASDGRQAAESAPPVADDDAAREDAAQPLALTQALCLWVSYRRDLGPVAAARHIGAELNNPRITRRLQYIFPEADPGARKTPAPPPLPSVARATPPGGETDVAVFPEPTESEKKLNAQVAEIEAAYLQAAVRLFELYQPKLGAVKAAELAGQEVGGTGAYVNKLRELYPQAAAAKKEGQF